MKLLIPLMLLGMVVTNPAKAGEAEAIEMAKDSTHSWLSLTDQGQYEASWEAAAVLFQSAISKEDWAGALGSARTPLGALNSRDTDASSAFSSNANYPAVR